MQGQLKEAGRHTFQVEVCDKQKRSGQASLEVEAIAGGFLDVTVKDGVSEKLVAGASVTMGGKKYPVDNKGFVRLCLPPELAQTLVVEASGFKARTARGSVAAGQTKPYVCLLEPNSGVPEAVATGPLVTDKRFQGDYEGGWSVAPQGLLNGVEEAVFGEAGNAQFQIRNGRVDGTLQGNPKRRVPPHGTFSGSLVRLDKNGTTAYVQGSITVNSNYYGSYAAELQGERTHVFSVQGTLKLGGDLTVSGQYPTTEKIVHMTQGLLERSFTYKITLSGFRKRQ